MDPNPSAESNPDQSLLSDASDPPELPLKDRLQRALELYKNHESPISIRKIARMFGVPNSSLQNRIIGLPSKQMDCERRQRLNCQEEMALVEWILRLQAWGWPARVDQTREMARELLDKKNDTKPLGINWVQKFLRRHHQLKTAFIPPLDKERAAAQDCQIFQDWFALYLSVKTKYSVDDSDVWNMDEKGFMQGVIGKEKVVINKYKQKAYMTQPGNREWVSLIECVSLDGRKLKPWIIFKGKIQMTAWWEVLKEGHIALRENGWTDNEIGLKWLKEAFHPETAIKSDRWRMLLEVICSAWEKAGLHPYKPDLILDKFPAQQQDNEVYSLEIRSSTPENATLSYSGPTSSYYVLLTPKNTSDIQHILGHAVQGLPIVNALEKVGKAAMLAMAKSTIQSVTNAELVALNQRKKAKAGRPTASYGAARFMNEDVINERKALAAAKVLNREWAHFGRIPVDIFKPKQPVTATPRRQSLHQLNRAFQEEWAGLGGLSEDLFPIKWTALPETPTVKKASRVKKAPAVKKASAVKKTSTTKKTPATKKASAAKKPPVRKTVTFKETEQEQPPASSPERISARGRLLRTSKAMQASKKSS